MAKKLVDWGWPPNKSAYLGALLTGHNVSSTVFDQLWTKQGGCCGGCREALAYPLRNEQKQGLQPKIDRRPREPKSWKDVRGLLCSECRSAVKMLLADRTHLQQIVRYLRNAGDWE